MMASLVHDVANVAPHRRKRLSILSNNSPTLIEGLVNYGLIDEWISCDEEIDLDYLSILELEPFNPSVHYPTPSCTW